jgi:ketopantoate reductase
MLESRPKIQRETSGINELSLVKPSNHGQDFEVDALLGLTRRRASRLGLWCHVLNAVLRHWI